MNKEKGKIFDLKIFSELMHYVKPYKGIYYFVMGAAILLSIFSTLSPYLLKVAVDDYIRPKDYDGMLLIISLMLAALLLEVIFQFLFVYFANGLGQNVIRDLRATLYKKIIGFKMFFSRSTVFATALTALGFPAVANDVNVYSYRQPELVKPLFDAFTEQSGITVNVQFLKKGLVEKLVAEGNRSPADVILTVDISRLNSVVEAGVTQPIISEILNNNIPAKFRDPENQWFALTTRARVAYASKKRDLDGEVTTYEDFADPKWKNRICTRSGTNAYNLALTSAVIANHGEDVAKNWLLGLKSNLARKPQGNDRAQVKAIYAGECDISIGNTYYMAKMLANPEQIEWANSVRIVFPKFKDGGTHMNVSGVAMTKAAPNKDNALKLIEWLSGDTAQEIYAEANGEYPVNPNLSPSNLVASWGTFIPDDTPLVEIAKLRPSSLELTEIVAFDE